MGPNLSVAEMLAHLQKKIAYHKEQEEEYARQEALNGEKRAFHEAEHRKAVERFEALQTASAAAGELLADVLAEVKPQPARPAAPPEEIRAGDWHWVAKLLLRVIEAKAPGEVFSASSLVAEIQQLWGSKLRHRIDPRTAQVTLRRWALRGRLAIAREGRSRHESLYTRPRE